MCNVLQTRISILSIVHKTFLQFLQSFHQSFNFFIANKMFIFLPKYVMCYRPVVQFLGNIT